jgi:RimJ/RimL family protein N-acetyltransferase
VAIHQNASDPCPAVDRAHDWRRGLPTLTDGGVVLRELRLQDARSLLAHLNDERVLRYIASCPSTVDGFRRFIRWTRAERRRGLHACFGIVTPNAPGPIGIIQIWPIERDFTTAEWGFVLGQSYWGTGMFARSARLFLDALFVDGAFGPPGVVRLEARAVDINGRGNGVLRKLSAIREGVLRGAFRKDEECRDQVMWSILASDWRAARERDKELN